MTDIKTQIKEFRIGEKIRGLRQQKRLTLQELSELTTLSKPLLSQIENQQVIPPLATLLKIAKGLKVDIHFFFADASNSQKYVLTRREDVREDEKVQRLVTNETIRPYTYHSLAQGLRHKHMDEQRIRPGVDEHAAAVDAIWSHAHGSAAAELAVAVFGGVDARGQPENTEKENRSA